MKAVRDIYGWETIVLEEHEDGVLVNWDHVVPGVNRFIPNEDIVDRWEVSPDCLTLLY